MLRLLLLGVLMLGCCCAKSQSGWYWMMPLPQGDQLNTVAFLDDETAIAVGNAGTILRSTDKGLTWSECASDISVALTDICVIDANTCFSVGKEGVIVKTTDAGVTWTTTFSDNPENWLISIDFATPDIGIAVGMSGALRTTDGGRTWIDIGLTKASLRKVRFFNDSIGVILGYSGNVYHTVDGGVTWSYRSPNTSNYFMDIKHFDDTTYVLCGSKGLAVYTTNSGRSWDRCSTSTTTGLMAMDFRNDTTGICVGENGTILVSTDRGMSWSSRASNITTTLMRIAPTTDSVYVALGPRGEILRSTNDGRTWTHLTLGFRTNLEDVAFTRANCAVAVGDSGKMYKTEDFGVLWTENTIGNARYRAIAFDSNNRNYGFAVGDSGVIQRTTDAGATWTKQNSGVSTSLSDVEFARDGRCFITGDWAVVLSSEDQGKTWQRLSTPATHGLYAIASSNKTIIAVGNEGEVIQSRDGGNTWVSTPFSSIWNLRDVAFSDDTTCFVIGGGDNIWRSVDAGVSWTSQSHPGCEAYFRLAPISPDTIYMTGSGGALYRTVNHGNWWELLLSPTEHVLVGIEFFDRHTAIAVGAYGTIVGTSTLHPVSVSNEPPLPATSRISLASVFPNPTSDFTTIPYHVARGGRVLIDVCDAVGNVVAVVVDDVVDAGDYEAPFQTHTLPSGVYYFRIHTGAVVRTKSLVVMK